MAQPSRSRLWHTGGASQHGGVAGQRRQRGTTEDPTSRLSPAAEATVPLPGASGRVVPATAAIAGATLIGALVRGGHTLASDFPLNDGGLFYIMVQDLQRAGFALPVATSFNAAGLPYAYPPLGFYVAAALAAGPWSLLDLFRWLPLAFSVLTIPAFWLLARAVIPSQRTALLATGAFALLPMSFQWIVMGGGLTRGLGFVCAILGLWQVCRLYTRPSRRGLVLTAALAAATVLSHPAMAWFLAYSSLVLFLAHGRTSPALRHSLVVALGTIALSGPWWLTVLSRHGLYPLLASGGSGWGPFAPLQLLTLSITNEPFFPVLGALAALGALACLLERRAWLPVWLGVMVLLDARSPLATASVPIALLVGIGAGEVLLPWLARRAPSPPRVVDGARQTSGPPRRAPLIVLAVTGFVAFLAMLGATVDLNGVLVGLTPDQRAAMQWAAESTPPESRYLVVTGSLFPARDRVSEWFPALSRRPSVTTIQGYEWAPGQTFAERVERYPAIQRCAYRDAACVAKWARASGVGFDYLYLPKGTTGASANAAVMEDCCWALRASAAQDPSYQPVYDGPGASIYRWRGPSAGAGLSRQRRKVSHQSVSRPQSGASIARFHQPVRSGSSLSGTPLVAR